MNLVLAELQSTLKRKKSQGSPFQRDPDNQEEQNNNENEPKTPSQKDSDLDNREEQNNNDKKTNIPSKKVSFSTPQTFSFTNDLDNRDQWNSNAKSPKTPSTINTGFSFLRDSNNREEQSNNEKKPNTSPKKLSAFPFQIDLDNREEQNNNKKEPITPSKIVRGLSFRRVSNNREEQNNNEKIPNTPTIKVSAFPFQMDLDNREEQNNNKTEPITPSKILRVLPFQRDSNNREEQSNNEKKPNAPPKKVSALSFKNIDNREEWSSNENSPKTPSKKVTFQLSHEENNPTYFPLNKAPFKKVPKENLVDEEKMFKKRDGITSDGKEYETILCANFAFRFAQDKTIKKFEISADDAEFETFDDIVFEVETSTNTKKYAIQAKASSRPLTLQNLTEPKKKFGLNKYLQSFIAMRQKNLNHKLVLLTNRSFSPDKDEEIIVEFNNDVLHVKIVRTKLPSILQNCQLEDHCYKFEILPDKTTLASTEVLLLYQEFFEKFRLCTEQPSLETMKKTLSEFMKEVCSCDKIYAKFIKYIGNWMLLEGSKFKLNKSPIQRTVILLLTDRFIQPIALGSIKNNAEILQKVVSKFKVTIFDKDLAEHVRTIWSNSEDYFLDMKTTHFVNKLYQITSQIEDVSKLSDKEISKLLWAGDRSPLIFEENLQTQKAIDFSNDEKFILLGNGHELSSEHLVFRKLSNIKSHPELYQEVVKSFKCCLSGKEMSLEELIAINETFEIVITPNELVQMVEGPYVIKNEPHDLPVSYIKRMVSRNAIDFGYLKTVDNDTLVLVSNAPDPKQIEDNSKQNVYNDLEQNGNDFNIWVIKEKCSQDDFDKLCQKIKYKKRYHHFSVANGHLEWLKSVEGISDIAPFRIADDFADEDSLITIDNNINVIVDEPRTGKSVMLKHLANALSGSYWIVYFTRTEMSQLSQISLEQKQFENYLFEKKFSTMTIFDKMLLKVILDQQRVVFVWDGLDEISKDNFDTITGFILRQNKMVHFVTCRTHLKASLESKLCVMSRTLRHLNLKKKRLYLQERLKDIYQDNLDTVIFKLDSILSSLQFENFFNVPIHLYMLTEYLIKNPSLIDSFSVTDLYKYIVEETIKQTQKHLQITPRDSSRDEIRIYQEIALSAIFDKETLSDLNVDFISPVKPDILGFFDCVQNKPHFFHQSYTEYFAATYFEINCSKISKTIWFDKKYSNVRFFFDVLLAGKSSLHLAALYKNFNLLKESQNLQMKDYGGRSVLHLICSWGQKFSPAKVEKVSGGYKLHDDGDFEVKEETFEYKRVLDHLLERVDFNEKDEIFKMDALEYAKSNTSIFAILSIARKKKPITISSKEMQEFCNRLYCSTRFGFNDIIKSYSKLEVIKLKKGNTLLDLVVENCDFSTVNHLLQGKYKKYLNHKDHFGETPLHVAAKRGNFKVVETLVDHGGDVNAQRDSGETPFFVAAQNGHHFVMELLLPKKGSDKKGFRSTGKVCTPDDVDKTGWTPLFYACKNGYEKVVSLLINLGADVNKMSSIKKTPLMLACENGHVEIVEMIIKTRVDINAVDLLGWTPIFYAAKNGRKEVVELLRKHGARTDIVDKANKTYDLYDPKI